MPSSTAGFQSHILNPTNQTSPDFVAIIKTSTIGQVTMIWTWWNMSKRITLGTLNYTCFLHPRLPGEYWNHGSESRNNYAFGNEYSKGGFQVSAAMGIFDGKRERSIQFKNCVFPTYPAASCSRMKNLVAMLQRITVL
jgi:hypothetical protein